MKTNMEKLVEMKTPTITKGHNMNGSPHYPCRARPVRASPYHLKYKFDNGFGASVVSHDFSYGGDKGLLELAVLGKDDELCYSTPVTSDIEGHLDAAAAFKLLNQIEALPAEQ